MARNREEEEEEINSLTEKEAASASVKSKGRTDPFLVVCKCFSVITSLIAILCIAVNVLSAVLSVKERADIFGVVLRCYAVVIGILVVLAETEWEFILKFSKVLEYWAGRGMLQIFVAVMTRAYPDVYDRRKDLLLLQEIASYLLLACGVLYVILGVLCIGCLKRSRQVKEISRGQAIKDLEELERRREELEGLLIGERERGGA